LPLPVVNEAGEPIGVITERSLLAAIKSTVLAIEPTPPAPLATLPGNEECLRQLVENSREVLYVHDIPPQRVLYVSPAYEAIWGQSRVHLYQQPYAWLEAIHPEDRERIRKDMWALQQEELVELEYRIVRSDGSIRWIYTRTTPIRDANGTIYRRVGNAADVTERKLAEQSLQRLNQELEQRIQERTAELEQSNQQLRAEILEREQVQAALAHEQAFLRCLLDTIPDLIFYKDVQGVYQVVNRAFEVFSGYHQSEIVGHDDRDLFSATAAIAMQEKDRRVLSQQQALRNEEVATYANAQQRWVETLKVPFFSRQGELAGLIGISRDITDRKQTEATLAARERYLQAVVEVQRQLLAARGNATNYEDALAPLGKASDASRVYLFTNHRDENGNLFMRQQAEWCAAGIQPEIDNPDLQHLPYEGGFARWAEVLSQGGAIVGAVANFSETERLVLEPQGILSILVIPLIVNGTFYGFIGFDHCLEESVDRKFFKKGVESG
jgi:PAS domain S-box-containing protein